jgi:PAS domain S-box-containing protein
MSKEIVLNDYTFLVSETDEKGNIIFANDDFCKVAGYHIDELIGQPHNIIRICQKLHLKIYGKL